MRCPFCRSLSNRVVDSRLAKDGTSVRRRRHCESCNRRFTTYEYAEETLPVVVKKGGARQPYDRSKVLSGVEKACEKRPVATHVIHSFLERLETKLIETGEREVDSRFVGEQIMAFLRQVDQVAYVRFASVYRSFKDLGEFMDQLEELLEESKEPLDSEPRSEDSS